MIYLYNDNIVFKIRQYNFKIYFFIYTFWAFFCSQRGVFAPLSAWFKIVKFVDSLLSLYVISQMGYPLYVSKITMPVES